MVKFLIATHGFLADGFKSSIKVLMGDDIAESVKTVNAFVEDGTTDPKSEIEHFCNSLGDGDELVIFTDLMYGSVNQFALPFTKKENVIILTGANFPLICEVISKLTFSNEENKINHDAIKDIVEKAKDQIIFVENFFAESDDSKNKDYEEDFF